MGWRWTSLSSICQNSPMTSQLFMSCNVSSYYYFWCGIKTTIPNRWASFVFITQYLSIVLLFLRNWVFFIWFLIRLFAENMFTFWSLNYLALVSPKRGSLFLFTQLFFIIWYIPFADLYTQDGSFVGRRIWRCARCGAFRTNIEKHYRAEISEMDICWRQRWRWQNNMQVGRYKIVLCHY